MKKIKVLIKKSMALVLSIVLLLPANVSAAKKEDVKNEKRAIDMYCSDVNMDLNTIYQEGWAFPIYMLSSVYQSVMNSQEFRSAGTASAFETTLENLVYFDSFQEEVALENISETREVLGIGKEIYDTISGASEAGNSVTGKYKLFNVDAVSFVADQMIYVNKSVFGMAKVAECSDIMSHAIRVLKDKGEGNIQKAAKNIIRRDEKIADGKVGSASFDRLFNLDSVKQPVISIFNILFGGWSTATSVVDYVAGKETKAVDVSEAIVLYYNYMDVQDAIQNTRAKLNPEEYESAEAYIKDYKALSYAFVACAYKAQFLLNDALEACGEEKKKEVALIYDQTLAGILSVGMPDIETENVTVQPDIELDSYNYPELISQGDTYVCYGTIRKSDSSVLNHVVVEVRDIQGELCMKVSSGTLDGRNEFNILELDKDICLNQLVPGMYWYRVLADDNVILEKPFEVQKENGEFIITGYGLPKPQRAGSAYSVRGTVKASMPLKNVTVGIYNGDNTMITGKSDTPNSNAYQLSALDPYILFDALGAGEYFYKVYATNENGTTECLVNQPFYVY